MYRLALVTALALSIVFAPAANACRILKLKNDKGTANDLHFTTNKGNYDLNFSNLPNGGTIEVTLTASPNCQDIKITEWWWTNGGSVLGSKRSGEPQCETKFSGGPATGDGSIRVRIEGVDYFFSPTPGELPAQSFESFKLFLSSIMTGSRNLISVAETSPLNTVRFYGNDLGDPLEELDCSLMIPDSGQEIEVTMGIAVLPAAGQIGLGLLALALLVLSGAWIHRRRVQEARGARA